MCISRADGQQFGSSEILFKIWGSLCVRIIFPSEYYGYLRTYHPKTEWTRSIYLGLNRCTFLWGYSGYVLSNLPFVISMLDLFFYRAGGNLESMLGLRMVYGT